jgi:hypothetical protein
MGVERVSELILMRKLMKWVFMMGGFDETLTGIEMLMTLSEWVVPWASALRTIKR